MQLFPRGLEGEQFKSKQTGMGRRREGVEIDEIMQKLFMDNTSKELKTLDMGTLPRLRLLVRCYR